MSPKVNDAGTSFKDHYENTGLLTPTEILLSNDTDELTYYNTISYTPIEVAEIHNGQEQDVFHKHYTIITDKKNNTANDSAIFQDEYSNGKNCIINATAWKHNQTAASSASDTKIHNADCLHPPVICEKVNSIMNRDIGNVEHDFTEENTIRESTIILTTDSARSTLKIDVNEKHISQRFKNNNVIGIKYINCSADINNIDSHTLIDDTGSSGVNNTARNNGIFSTDNGADVNNTNINNNSGIVINDFGSVAYINDTDNNTDIDDIDKSNDNNAGCGNNMNNTDSINDKPFLNDPACFQNAIIDTQYNDNSDNQINELVVRFSVLVQDNSVIKNTKENTRNEYNDTTCYDNDNAYRRAEDNTTTRHDDGDTILHYNNDATYLTDNAKNFGNSASHLDHNNTSNLHEYSDAKCHEHINTIISTEIYDGPPNDIKWNVNNAKDTQCDAVIRLHSDTKCNAKVNTDIIDENAASSTKFNADVINGNKEMIENYCQINQQCYLNKESDDSNRHIDFDIVENDFDKVNEGTNIENTCKGNNSKFEDVCHSSKGIIYSENHTMLEDGCHSS